MARRRRASRRSGSRKPSSRITRAILIGLGLTLPVLYVVFTKTVFDPFEKPAPAFRLLVPRDIDLYAHRAKLASDLDLHDPKHPTPVVLQRWMRTLQWRDFAATEWARERGMPATLEELLAPVAGVLSGDTGPLDPIDDLLGSEVAVIGRDPFTAGHLAFLFRLSTAGKLAVEALDFQGVREGVLAGATRSEVIDEQMPEIRFHRLDLADGKSWFYFRESDLLVVGNQSELVRDVRRTVEQGDALSLGLSRLYLENVPAASAPVDERFSSDFSLDMRHFLGAYDLLPDIDRRNADAVANILPNLLDLELLRDAVGRLEVDKNRIDLEVFCDVAGDKPRAGKGGIQGADTFLVHERLGSALSLLPHGMAAAVTMNVDLTEFLQAVVAGLDPELVKLINDTIRGVARWNPTFNVNNLSQLIAELDRALVGRVTLAVRALDHDVPEGAQPVPTLAFFAPIRDLNAWEAIGQALINGNQVLGVASEKMWQQVNPGLGDHKVLPLPATSAEALSFIALEGETLVFTTDSDLTLEIIDVYRGMGKAVAGDPGVAELLQGYQRRATRANVVAWVDSREFRRVLEPYAEWRAELDTQLDFAVLRAQHRREILRKEYPQYVDRELPQDLETELEARLDTIIFGLEDERLATVVPEAARHFREAYGWLDLLDQATASLRLGEHTMGAAVHVETAID